MGVIEWSSCTPTGVLLDPTALLLLLAGEKTECWAAELFLLPEKRLGADTADSVVPVHVRAHGSIWSFCKSPSWLIWAISNVDSKGSLQWIEADSQILVVKSSPNPSWASRQPVPPLSSSAPVLPVVVFQKSVSSYIGTSLLKETSQVCTGSSWGQK